MPRWATIGGFFRDVRRTAHIRLGFANLVCRCIPNFASGYVRSHMYRFAGLDIARSAFLMDNIELASGLPGFTKKLHIGEKTLVSTHVTINLDGPVHIGDRVTLGPFVKIYTGSHELGDATWRCTPKVTGAKVVIEDGAWIAVGATILPGVRVGRGAVVAAGAVVTKDVADNTFVSGVPAVVTRELPEVLAP